MGGGDASEPQFTFIVPVTHWSDGSVAAGHDPR
jgi:hypothetical protein